MDLSWYALNNLSPGETIGIDEVGRGPLAGPVVAAAVWVSDIAATEIEQSHASVNDSKKLSSRQRQKVLSWLKTQTQDAIRYSIGEASVEEIDKLNILQATFLAMERAYHGLKLDNLDVLVDGNRAPQLQARSVKTVVKGDSNVLSIALASIIAKEYRDNLMRNLALHYPDYEWNSNVGYGTQQHIEAIIRYGVTEHHRKTFSPVKELLLAKTIVES